MSTGETIENELGAASRAASSAALKFPRTGITDVVRASGRRYGIAAWVDTIEQMVKSDTKLATLSSDELLAATKHALSQHKGPIEQGAIHESHCLLQNLHAGLAGDAALAFEAVIPKAKVAKPTRTFATVPHEDPRQIHVTHSWGGRTASAGAASGEASSWLTAKNINTALWGGSSILCALGTLSSARQMRTTDDDGAAHWRPTMVGATMIQGLLTAGMAWLAVESHRGNSMF